MCKLTKLTKKGHQSDFTDIGTLRNIDITDVFIVNPLSNNPTKWSKTLKQFVGNLLSNCLSVFDHFVKLGLKGLTLKRFHTFS